MLIPLLLLLLGVIVAKFLKFFKLVEDQSVTFCAKYVKAGSAPWVLILYCTRLEPTPSLLICCNGVMWTKTTFTLSLLLGWAFSHEFLFFSKSNDFLDRKEFLAIGCWYGLTTLYTEPLLAFCSQLSFAWLIPSPSFLPLLCVILCYDFLGFSVSWKA